MTRDAWLEINLDNLRHNIKVVKSKIKEGTDIMGVIKADAYGHGYQKIAEIFIEEGIDNFAFATLDEAINLKKIYSDKNAMILGICPINCEDKIIEYGIEQSIQSYEDAKKLDSEAEKQGKIAKVHINVDTGMSRFGFVAENDRHIEDLIKVFELKNTEIKGIFTHFSSSADDNWRTVCQEQLDLFEKVLNYIKGKGYQLPKVHVSNSGAILLNANVNFDMVRMGIVTYGLKPSDNEELSDLDLKPIMSLKARIVSIKELEKGRKVGYSGTYELEKNERIATLPLGYADGLRANCDNSYKVYLNGQRHNLAGRICMDAMMIRINNKCQAKIGDEVTLFGYHKDGILPIEELSDALGYINYELATGLKLRLKRYYIYQGKFLKED